MTTPYSTLPGIRFLLGGAFALLLTGCASHLRPPAPLENRSPSSSSKPAEPERLPPGLRCRDSGSDRFWFNHGAEPVTYKGYVPPRSVVIPGSYPKKFAAGEYGVPCALIIGQRKESTDTKTSLNDALRDFDVPV